jgi:dTMP kinase
MRTGFLALAEEFKERFVVIDGTREIDIVAQEVAEAVLKYLNS